MNRDTLDAPAVPIGDRWVTSQPAPTGRPMVSNPGLHLSQGGGSPKEDQPTYCQLDSPAWFVWLETAIAFRFQTTQTIPLARGHTRPASVISVRKEQRRRGVFWYAYLRKGGQLLKRYVGRSENLTGARLDEVALDLNLG